MLVAEDAAFWQHDGVDYEDRRSRLSWTGRADTLRGEHDHAAIGENLFLSLSRNPARKLRELIIALA